jgi:hypothetical protein
MDLFCKKCKKLQKSSRVRKGIEKLWGLLSPDSPSKKVKNLVALDKSSR